MKTLRILMLGWEYPPAVTGGLGKACYGLSRALSRHVQLSMIVPHAKVQENSNIHLSGLNHLPDWDFTVERYPERTYEEFSEVVMVETDLSPYPVPVVKSIKWLEDDTLPESMPSVMDAAAIRDLFASEENYGLDLMEKVDIFTQTALRIAEKQSFDLIHAHDWLTMQAGIAIKKASGKPLVVHVHSLETDRIGMAGRNARNKIYHIEYNSMMQADLVLPVSHYTKSQILEHYPGIAPDKIVPVYNAIDHDDMAAELPDIVQTPIATNRKIVLFMGRITYQKGPEFLLQTAEHLLSIDKEIRFVVVGSGDMQSWMTARVAEKELGEYFVFTGYLPPHRLGELLRVANVYFMPSVSEPFGLAALEAAQFGVPSVISRQSGVSEVLQGVLKADCWDTIQFANYIYALLHYKSLREVLVAENKAAINSMSWDKTAQQVVELYQQLLESTTASLLQPL